MSDDSEKVAGMAIMSMAQDIDELKAEIERLRSLVAEKDTQLSQIPCRHNRCIEFAEAEAEIERLRGELRLCIHVDKHIHITSGLNIEIERLRSQLAAMECGYKSCRDTAEEEFARLRELLREALLPPVRLRVIPQGEDWIKRVREALGE